MAQQQTRKQRYTSLLRALDYSRSTGSVHQLMKTRIVKTWCHYVLRALVQLGRLVGKEIPDDIKTKGFLIGDDTLGEEKIIIAVLTIKNQDDLMKALDEWYFQYLDKCRQLIGMRADELIKLLKQILRPPPPIKFIQRQELVASWKVLATSFLKEQLTETDEGHLEALTDKVNLFKHMNPISERYELDVLQKQIIPNLLVLLRQKMLRRTSSRQQNAQQQKDQAGQSRKRTRSPSPQGGGGAV